MMEFLQQIPIAIVAELSNFMQHSSTHVTGRPEKQKSLKSRGGDEVLGEREFQ